MSNYGQAVTFSTGSAPHLCAGVCLNFRTKDNLVRQMEDAEDGAILAAIQHSRTVDFSFDVKFTDASTDFPDLSGGAKITLAGLETEATATGATAGGCSLISRAVETWRTGQSKTGSIAGTYYPNVSPSGGAAIATLSAFTPVQSIGGLHPAAKLKWGTSGMTHGAGVLHGLTLTQELQLLPEEVSPAGTILSVFTANYMRTLHLEILPLTSGTAPLNGTTLTVIGAPSHAAGFRIENVEQTREIRGRKMLRCEAFWFNGID